MSSNATASPSQIPEQAATLLMEGRVIEASRMLAESLAQNDSPDLWNDWAVAQLHLAECGFRRALQGNASHTDAAANLGLLLFCNGKRAEAAVFLERSLADSPAPLHVHIQNLLDLRAPQPPTLDSDAIRREVYAILKEYFLKQNRSESVVTPQGLILVSIPNRSGLKIP